MERDELGDESPHDDSTEPSGGNVIVRSAMGPFSVALPISMTLLYLDMYRYALAVLALGLIPVLVAFGLTALVRRLVTPRTTQEVKPDER